MLNSQRRAKLRVPCAVCGAVAGAFCLHHGKTPRPGFVHELRGTKAGGYSPRARPVPGAVQAQVEEPKPVRVESKKEAARRRYLPADPLPSYAAPPLPRLKPGNRVIVREGEDWPSATVLVTHKEIALVRIDGEPGTRAIHFSNLTPIEDIP